MRSPSSEPRHAIGTAYVQGVACDAGGHIRAPDFDICPWNTDPILYISEPSGMDTPMSRHLHACTQTSPQQSVQLQAFHHGTFRPKLDCRLTGQRGF